MVLKYIISKDKAGYVTYSTTELSITKGGKQTTEREKRMLDLYEQGQVVYADSYMLWGRLIKNAYFRDQGIILESKGGPIRAIAVKYNINIYRGRISKLFDFIPTDSPQRLWETASGLVEQANKQYEGPV